MKEREIRITLGGIRVIVRGAHDLVYAILALEEAVRCFVAYINIPHQSIGLADNTVLAGMLDSPAVAEALAKEGE
mgnify:CR=1 FL=1